MKSEKLAVVIIAFNRVDLIVQQAKCMRKFCLDDYDLIVVDNSNDPGVSAHLLSLSGELGFEYFQTRIVSSDGSVNHATACNMAYQKYCIHYGYFLFLDHDCFPVKSFSVSAVLSGKIIAGMPQTKPTRIYFWPGCLMINNNRILHSLVDFAPNSALGLDTGGNLFKVIDYYGLEQCFFLDEEHVKNPSFNKSFYDFYALINSGVFMHFINASNWNNSAENTLRVESLYRILAEKIESA